MREESNIWIEKTTEILKGKRYERREEEKKEETETESEKKGRNEQKRNTKIKKKEEIELGENRIPTRTLP